MPPSEQPRVFISYARKDGAALAQRLQEDLKDTGFDAWLDTQRIAGGRVWSTEIEDAIKSCRVMVALMSPASYASEICRSEQLLALDQGNRVIPVLAVKGSDRPVYLYARQYRDFADHANYAVRLAELLADIRGDATAALPDSYRKTRVTYLTGPPRVANYLERPEALHALRAALFAEDHRQPIALTMLTGMGGIGKTVLAKALTDDEVVQRAFPDGIVWITAGKKRKRDFIEDMREVAKALGDDVRAYDTALACENEYRSTIANKAALIVVDDVWSKSDIEPLLAESPRSRFLFTTRDAAIGRFVGAQEHRADLLNIAQSRELLALWANLPVEELPAAAEEVIAECGRLPLALSVVGAMLRAESAEFWRDTLDLLRKADLSAIQEQLPEGQDSFFKAVEVSFESLKPEMQERYKALAVVLEDMAAPLAILETLWNVDRPEARRISRNFMDRSLAQRDGADEGIRLHDLQLDYVRAQYPREDKEALKLIQGAIRLSLNVLASDPEQFASQVVGRLVSYHEIPAVDKFTKRVAEGARRPWLRVLHPALDPPGTALIRTLEGHSVNVTSVVVSADGRRVVSASEDGTLKVWDLETGRELRTIQTGTELQMLNFDKISGLAVSEDGRRAVSISEYGTLKVWNLETCRELFTLARHSGPVVGVAVSADGRRAVSASDDQRWEPSSHSGLSKPIRPFGSLDEQGVAMSADGRRAISARSSTLKVWDLETGRELWSLAGGEDSELKVWDLETGRELQALPADGNRTAMSADGRRAVSASWDETLKVWDLETGRELRTFLRRSSSFLISTVGMSADGSRVVSASDDKTLTVWDVESGREIRTLQGFSSLVRGVPVSADARRAVSAEYSTLKVWDLETIHVLRTSPVGHSAGVNAVAVSTDGRLAVSASLDNTLKVWDVEKGCELRTLEGHSDSVSDVAVSADGRLAVSASWDKTLKVWDVENGCELCSLEGHSQPVDGVAMCADGRLAVSASRDHTLKVWDLETRRELRTLETRREPRAVTHPSPGLFSTMQSPFAVLGVAVSGDGRRAVSAGEAMLNVWDLETGRALETLACVGTTAAVSADGRRVVGGAVTAEGFALKVWDLERGCELRTGAGFSSFHTCVAVSADGKRAVSAPGGRTLQVWDLETGEVLATFTCDDSAYCCAFSAARKLIVAGDADGHVHFLRLEEPKAKG